MRSPKREPRSRDSFLLSLSIAIPPARFLVNRGIFPLPPSRMQSHHRCRAASSFLRSPRERERGREGAPPCFVDGISYLSGCCVFGLETDATTSQTLLGFRREPRIGRNEAGGAEGKRRDVCPSSRDILRGGSFLREKRAPNPSIFAARYTRIAPKFLAIFSFPFISSRFLAPRFLRQVKNVERVDDRCSIGVETGFS